LRGAFHKIDILFCSDMPFTVSHAAAVLPFRKLNLVWSAFIVGSMAPDFPYIVASTTYRNLGHDSPGVIFFTIPASFAALWLFHNVVKRPVIGLMPSGMQARLRPYAGDFSFQGGRRFLAITASILLGIATHIVWDSFTHAFTWPWREFPFLHHRIHLPLLGAVPGYSVAQYASTFAGMLALVVWVWFWYRSSEPATRAITPPPSRFPLGVAMFALAGGIGLSRALLVVGIPENRGRADLFLLTFGVTSLALAFWQLLLYCVLVSTRQVGTNT
jgi:hypothetical protein